MTGNDVIILKCTFSYVVNYNNINNGNVSMYYQCVRYITYIATMAI